MLGQFFSLENHFWDLASVNSYRQEQLLRYFLLGIYKNSFQIVVVAFKVAYFLSILFSLQNLCQVILAPWAMVNIFS